MNTESTDRKPRSTHAQQNGNRGQLQVAERLEEFGWSAKSITPDSGEDLLVEVQDNLYATGLHFFVQIKSPDTLKRKNGQVIYGIKTKDLKHWDYKNFPVFLILWDTKNRQGYWHCTDEILADLSRRRPEWASKDTVEVHIPQGNLSDNSGLARLRKRAADKVFPLVAAKERQLRGSISFQFPDTPEGRAEIEGLRRHRATGESVTLSGEHISELSFSDWFTRLYGPEATRAINRNGQLTIGPTHSEEIVDLRLCALSSQKRLVEQQSVRVKAISIGEEQVTYSNQNTGAAFIFTFIAHKSGLCTFHFSLAGAVSSATALHETMPLLVALSEGGFLRVETTSHAEKWKERAKILVPCLPQKKLSPDPHYRKIIAQLAEIEQKTSVVFRLGDEGIPHEQIYEIEDLLELLRRGVRERDAKGITWTMSGFKPSEYSAHPRQMIEEIVESHRKKEMVEFSANGDLSANIMDVEVPLGPQQVTIEGRLTEECFSRLEQMIKEEAFIEPLRLTWQKGIIKEVCFDWLPESYELSSDEKATQTLPDQTGYQEINIT